MTQLKYIENNDSKKLQIKDLITLGLYSILLILLMGVAVGVGTVFFSVVFGGKVYFATFSSVSTALFCGAAYSLIFNKINKNMTIFIMTLIMALFLALSGHSLVGSITMFIFGIIAEYFFRKGKEYLSYIAFNLGTIGIVLPMFFMKDSYIKHLQGRNYPQEKIDLVMSNSSMTTFVIIIILTIVASIIGIYLGRKLYYKNFAKAGL